MCFNLTYANGMEKSGVHVDHKYPHKQIILYLNDCDKDAKTVIVDDKGKDSKIITPEKSILRSEAEEVTIPSYEGQMGILKDHIPLITFLRPGYINIKDRDEKKYFVEGSHGRVSLLCWAAKKILNFWNRVRRGGAVRWRQV